MELFETDYSKEKDCRLTRYLDWYPVEILEVIMQNEDCFVPGYETNFPNRISFKQEELEKRRRSN